MDSGALSEDDRLGARSPLNLLNESIPVTTAVASAIPAAAAVLAASGLTLSEGQSSSQVNSSWPSSPDGPTSPGAQLSKHAFRNQVIGESWPSSPEDAGQLSPVGVDRLKGVYFRAVRSLAAENDKDERQKALVEAERHPPITGGVHVDRVHDQLTSLRKEIARLREEVDAVRGTNSRMEVHQSETTRHWSKLQAEVAKETMAVIVQMTEEQRKVRAEAEQLQSEHRRKDSEVAQQLASLRRALDEEARSRASGDRDREEAQDEHDSRESRSREVNLSFEKVCDKLEVEMRAMRQALDQEINERRADSSKCREALSAVSGEAQACYTQLREEMTQTWSDHQSDIANLQENLREHSANITEHTAQIREEQALRQSTRHQMELKFREEIDTAVGAQRLLMEEARQVTQNLQSLASNVLQQEAMLTRAGSTQVMQPTLAGASVGSFAAAAQVSHETAGGALRNGSTQYLSSSLHDSAASAASPSRPSSPRGEVQLGMGATAVLDPTRNSGYGASSDVSAPKASAMVRIAQVPAGLVSPPVAPTLPRQPMPPGVPPHLAKAVGPSPLWAKLQSPAPSFGPFNGGMPGAMGQPRARSNSIGWLGPGMPGSAGVVRQQSMPGLPGRPL